MVMLLTATVAVPVPVSSSTSAATASECDQSVRHDAFRTDEAVETFNSTGKVASRVQNTLVSVEDATGFVRLRAENPNGYCVSYEVTIASDVVSPADLGTVSSNSEEHDARWRAAQNLSSGVVYTRVTFSLPAGANATFAPSSVRVESLSWTGAARREGSGVLSGISDWWGSDKLEKKTYEIRPTRDASRITVDLENDGQRVEEWQASYTVDGETREVTQDASEPVYYTESADSVTFHFSDEARAGDGQVTFTADPNPLDKARYSAERYIGGITRGVDIFEELPFTVDGGEAVA
ncbi:hypothetical protein [Halorarius halobius]|uniref:hypothetical protein n=1 Tax=Halorarius halobius TaxID=2962671 RepID=UPI0020CC9A39|nr:hypothetical protein [Halorarius halobius]